MAIAAYSKTCAKNTAGNYHKVFFNSIDAMQSTTITSGEISAITAGGTGEKFQNYVGEIDSVQFKSEGNGGQNYFTTQTLTMKFAKKTKTLLAAIEQLVELVSCGIVAIHVDGNGTAWLDGYDSSAVDPTARPFNKMKVSFDSGLKPSDAEMNAVTIELTRESEWENTPFDSTLSAAILAGSASYIDYTN